MENNISNNRSISEIISQDIYPVIKDLLPEPHKVTPHTIGAEVMREMRTLLPWNSMISPSLLWHYNEFSKHFGLTHAQKGVVAKGLLLWIDKQNDMVKLIHDSIDYHTKLTHIQKLRMFACTETGYMGAYLLRQRSVPAYVMSCGIYDEKQQAYLDHHTMTLYTTQKGIGLSDMIADLTQDHVRILDYWMGIDDTASGVLSKVDSFFLLDRKKVKTCCTIPHHSLGTRGNLLEPKPKDYISWQKRFYLSQYNVRGFEVHKDFIDVHKEYLPPISSKAYRVTAVKKPSALTTFLARLHEYGKVR